MNHKINTFKLQAVFTARKIKRYYHGNLNSFVKHWDPKDNPTQWVRNVREIMNVS